MSVHFVRVYGNPATQGSKRSFVSKTTGRVITKESSATRHRDWRAAVASAAGEHVEKSEPGSFPIVALPVRLTLAFFLPRPKSHYSVSGEVKERFLDFPHIIKPDCSKLARAVEDACTGILWMDDSQIIDLLVSKRYATPGVLGVVIEVVIPS